MKRDRRGFRGSITVFLCLMLVCIMGLTGACLEYARGQTISCQTQMAVDSAAESIFAGYHDPLFATYQVLGRLVPSGSFETLEKETLRYVQSYGGNASSWLDQGSLTSYKAEDATWSQVAFLTDQNGAIFTHMAAEAMLASGVTVVTDEWKRRLGLSDPQNNAALTGNANKDSWNKKDVMGNYDSWSGTLEKEQQKAAEEAASRGPEDGPMEPAGPSAKGQKILNLVETMKSLLTRSPIELVMPKGKKISKGTISSSGLPSSLSASAKSRKVGDPVSPGNTLLFHEYLMRHMDCFIDESDKKVAYELEYLIAGKKSDKANLESVVNRLMWMRTAMNLIYLNQSPGKRSEMMAAATAAVGWTGVVPLINATAELLMVIWATAESIVDVRTLLAGEKVPLMKNDATWNLSLEGMAMAGKDKSRCIAGDKGLSYVDYLRICLYLKGGSSLTYRAMDVVQWNICRMEPGFTMQNCMVAGTLTAETGAKPMFSPLYGSLGRIGDNKYRKKSTFTYL